MDTDQQEITIKIPSDKTIALTLSGGADTALLTYLVCKELLDTGYRPEDRVRWIFTIPKRDGAELYPAGIIQWINRKLNINLPAATVVRVPNLHGLHHSTQVWSSVLHMLDAYEPDILYMGDQRAAPEQADLPGVRPFRSSTIEGPRPGRVIFPVNHLYKYHTVDLFYKLDIVSLLELTHSCTQQQVGRCGQCYHCSERQWAFDQLERVDPGNM
jgi:hypothetical protein